MTDCARHYAQLLAPVYEWAAGGFDAAAARGDAELQTLLADRTDGLAAVDLGAGFGMHAVPLARRGCRVVAIDSSPLLLATLRERAGDLPLRIVEDDLMNFPAHLAARPDLILCMGDTLTHLASVGEVERLAGLAAAALGPGGRFVASFRDYTPTRTGADRFVLVNSDRQRILTCFLEYLPEHVLVQDVLHERFGHGWSMRVGAYRKIRLAPDHAASLFAAAGFSVRLEPGSSGMVRMVATRH
jgi:hypothetical protein